MYGEEVHQKKLTERDINGDKKVVKKGEYEKNSEVSRLAIRGNTLQM